MSRVSYIIHRFSLILLLSFLPLCGGGKGHTVYLTDGLYNWKDYYEDDQNILKLECFFRKLILNPSTTSQTYLPPLFYPDMKLPNDAPVAEVSLVEAAIAGKVLVTAVKAARAAGSLITGAVKKARPDAKNKDKAKEASKAKGSKKKRAIIIGAIIAAAAVGGAIARFLHVCPKSYVIMPHEYFNLKAKEAGATSPLYSADDIPYFYHCTPGWEPSQPKNPDNPTHPGKLYTEYPEYRWGYKDKDGPYCQGSRGTLAVGEMKDRVGQIGYLYNKMDPSSGDIRWFKAGEKRWIGEHKVFAFYNNSGGSVRLCLGSSGGGIPYIVGCTPIPPPGEAPGWDAEWVKGIANTRCMYLIKDRSDLITLGDALGASPNHSKNYSVKKFLMSDWHITSTIVGCTKDMMIGLFVSSPDKPIFQLIQERFKPVAAAAIALSIALMSARVLATGNVMSTGQIISYISKLVIIYVFISTNVWSIIVPALLHLPEEIADIFMNAHNTLYDPVEYCKFEQGGRNILSNRIISQNLNPTPGVKDGVLLSVWDLVDCKIANYLNLGTCTYSAGGMMVVWMMSAAFWASGYGAMLGAMLFMYCFIVLQIFFRLVHIFVLSFFMITILCLLSPLFLIASLFSLTNGMYERWLKSLVGYTLYPGFLFAIIAVIFTALNFVYYGKPNNASTLPPNTLAARCDGVDSPYCLTMNKVIEDKGVNYHPCEKLETGDIFKNFQGSSSYHVFVTNTIHKELIEDYFKAMVKMALVTMLFSMSMKSVMEIAQRMFGVSGSIAGFASVSGGNIVQGLQVAKAMLGSKGGGGKKGGGKKGDGNKGDDDKDDDDDKKDNDTGGEKR